MGMIALDIDDKAQQLGNIAKSRLQETLKRSLEAELIRAEVKQDGVEAQFSRSSFSKSHAAATTGARVSQMTDEDYSKFTSKLREQRAK